MKYLMMLVVASFCLMVADSLAAQTPGRRVGGQTATKPATPVATPTPAATPAPPARTNSGTPASLAIINGQTITVADLDPAVRQEVEGLNDQIVQARRQVLDLQINTVLLDMEAKKRRVTTQQLYDVEVAKKVSDPTEAEIKQFFEANRDQLGEGDLQSLRGDVIAFIRGTREQNLTDEFVKRLRTTNAVVMGKDINAPGLEPTAVVATVAGQPITAGIVNERLKPIIYRLRSNTYELERAALERTVDDLLLLADANKRNMPPEEIVRSEITNKIHHATDAEVARFYADNKARITGDLASVRNQIAEYLEQQDVARLERALSDRLRKGANIRFLLTEPEAPVQIISTEGGSSRGEVNAPVTVVEFTDFECPSCAAMHPVLEEVLKSYGARVRFVVRNFPLSKHQHARKAAEAAQAANAQGKFFEYTALLFKRQSALDVLSLKKYATELGLDRARFDAALDGGTYAGVVKHDTDDGEIYGINSTPTIFVNGVMLTNLSAEGLRAAIDKALSKAGGR
jgi:protein-disulfide isomerase